MPTDPPTNPLTPAPEVLQQQLQTLYASKSWRATAPLRAAADGMRAMRRRVLRAARRWVQRSARARSASLWLWLRARFPRLWRVLLPHLHAVALQDDKADPLVDAALLPAVTARWPGLPSPAEQFGEQLEIALQRQRRFGAGRARDGSESARGAHQPGVAP